MNDAIKQAIDRAHHEFVLQLAAEIRRVDGNHDLGANALAEALVPFLRSLPAAPAPVGAEPVAWWDGTTNDYRAAFSAHKTKHYSIPLYTAPAPAPDEENP